MRKLQPINRRAKPGFYAAAYPGQPRFLVLPSDDRGVKAAIQLDATAKRRAFTLIRLHGRPIAKAVWTGDVRIWIGDRARELRPNESPIGSVVLSNDGIAIQVLDQFGQFAEISFPWGDEVRSLEISRPSCRSWGIFADNAAGTERILFDSHPRSAGAQTS